MRKNDKNKKTEIKKEDVKKITSDEFDSVMKTILSASPQKKKVKK